MTGTCRISMHCTPIGPAIVIETEVGLVGIFRVGQQLRPGSVRAIGNDLTPALKSSVWQVATSQWVAAVKKLLVF
ncbi:unnamed protein product [Allacma fusca]|uniref:Uncharacterized protein n=1 Tax=Allacma fusca TaxID=39272 RepID=A0A8J2LMC7_9HEXA|nr:unnamed protein product [Allacma fusca]